MATPIDLYLLESQPRDDADQPSFPEDDGNEHGKPSAADIDDRLFNGLIIVPRPLLPWVKHGRRVFWILMPTFLHHSSTNAAPQPLHPSAWLDGLRGISALFVVCHHWSLVVMPADLRRGFMTDDHPMLLQLPYMRLMISGLSAVCVFFVVSGYALSYKPAKLTVQAKKAEFTTAMASSVFRRYLRLFLPTVATSFTVACLAHLKCYEVQPVPNQAAVQFRPPVFDSFSEQMTSWWSQFSMLSDPFSRDLERGRNFAYESVLWTIPVEYYGSMIVFLAHIAFYRLRPRIRISFNIFLVAYTVRSGYWHFFLFLSGLCIATLRIDGQAKHNTHEPTSLGPPPTSTSTTFDSLVNMRSSFLSMVPSGKDDVVKKAFQIVSFLGALWLLSFPEATAGIAPGYRTIVAMTPASYGNGDYFWIPIAAVWLVYTLDKSPFIQPLFTNRYSQYLGRISYSIYLVHYSMMWLYGIHLIKIFAALTGSTLQADSFSVSWRLSALLATGFFLPGTIFVADFVQRYVDVPSVKFAAWFESKVVSRTK